MAAGAPRSMRGTRAMSCGRDRRDTRSMAWAKRYQGIAFDDPQSQAPRVVRPAHLGACINPSKATPCRCRASIADWLAGDRHVELTMNGGGDLHGGSDVLFVAPQGLAEVDRDRQGVKAGDHPVGPRPPLEEVEHAASLIFVTHGHSPPARSHECWPQSVSGPSPSYPPLRAWW